MNESQSLIHPGVILAKEMKELGINARKLAYRLEVPDNRIYHIVQGRRSITADTALRLSRFFNTTAEYWLNLQNQYDLGVALEEVGEKLDEIRPYHPPDAIQASLNI